MSAGPEIAALSGLVAGQEIPFGGDRVTRVGEELAESFRPGDRLVVVQDTGALLHIPRDVGEAVAETVSRAEHAFSALAACSDDAISDFFDRFAAALADDDTFAPIAAANAADVVAAADRGRSTTRLVLDDTMRRGMIDGLLGWRDSPSRRAATVRSVDHELWGVEAVRAPLGVVGFVFEGRPNVFADACGVVRTGNTVVFRIGSDALGTARAIVRHALRPAVVGAGLPDDVVGLVDSPTHAAGHALFADRRLALAVARGSGPAVAELGAVASQAGTPVSLHGTGGAWMVLGASASPEVVTAAVANSLDRKVCNTLNVCAVLRSHADAQVTAVLDGLETAARRRDAPPRLHVVAGGEDVVPSPWFDRTVTIERVHGESSEPAASVIDAAELGVEWEWERSPEMTLVVVDSVAEAVELFNRHSPHFVASLISEEPAEHDWFYGAVDAPFVGNGFTRWVDGQYALDAPELGLSNWQAGRSLGRGAILSGDGIHTVRYRAEIRDHDVRR